MYVGFCKNLNCYTFFHQNPNFDIIKTKLVKNNRDKMNPCRTQKDRIKFCPTKMKNENLIAIFEESGSSMTSVTNENESTRRK